jgi:type I restriction enzyme, S subunit
MAGKYLAYAEYKSAESKWMDILPAHWKRAPIKYLVATRITDGPHETPEFVDEGIPFLSAEAVKNCKLDFTKKRGCITRSLHEIYSKKCLPQNGDVFMVKSGNTTGAIAIVETDEEFNIWSPLALIRANKEKLLPRFVFYSMCADYFKTSVELSWSQGTQPNIGMGVIENLHVPLASVEEQRNIISFLDYETAKIDTLIEKQQQLIKLLKEKRQAVISHAVTKGLNLNAPMRDSGVEWLGKVPAHWEVSKFGYISMVVRGGSPRPAGDPELFNGDYSPWVTVAEITKDDDIYLTETATFLTKKGSDQCRIFSSGTLLLSNSGATLGVPKILQIDANANDGVVGFEELNLNHEFAYFYLSSLTDDIRERVKQGSGQPNLNTDIVKGISVPIPPENEVEGIVAAIAKTRAQFKVLTEKAVKGIELLQERRSALISAAVTGKIDLRNEQTLVKEFI